MTRTIRLLATSYTRTSCLAVAALAAALLSGPSAGHATIRLRDAAPVPGTHDPHGRALALGLHDPTARPVEGRRGGSCAAEVSQSAHPEHKPAPPACFADDSETEDFIAGRSRRPEDAGLPVTLSGSGGTAASGTTHGTTYPQVGYSCQYIDCSSSANYHWYTTASGNCTHTYPANDLFVDDTGVNMRYFRTTSRNLGEAYVWYCNKTAIYPNPNQDGYGASLWLKDQQLAEVIQYGTWRSMSWHFACDPYSGACNPS